MTGKADFTQDEWERILEGPPSAGMIVVTAQRGGTFRESFAIGRAYVEVISEELDGAHGRVRGGRGAVRPRSCQAPSMIWSRMAPSWSACSLTW